MTLTNLHFIQFYQAPTKANLAGKKSLMASIDNVSVTYGEGYILIIPRLWGGWGEQLQDYSSIKDLTGPASEDPLNLSFKLAPNLKGTVSYGGDNVHDFWW